MSLKIPGKSVSAPLFHRSKILVNRYAFKSGIGAYLYVSFE